MSAPIAGPEVRGELIHQRTYDISAYFEGQNHFRLVGMLKDVKPDGMWGVEDDEPMTIHHMELHLVVSALTLEITEVFTKMHVHPQVECVLIEAAYQQLVGLSIARGFSQKVKELFGGPRACTHIGALTNAMAPVAIQSLWAFTNREAAALPAQDEAQAAEIRLANFNRNRDTCHVWASEGPMFELLDSGGDVSLPLWGQQRLRELGYTDVETFKAR
jgi:Protein of unknown function (DUF2889)